MKFFLGFSQTLFRNLAKACSFYKYCPPAKASGNSQVAIHLGKPFFQIEFHKSFANNLPKS